MGSAQSAYLAASHKNSQLRAARAKKIASTRQGQRMMESRRMKKYIAKREKKLQEGADLRRRQEEDETKGERVWFSRCVLDGRLQHWVLIVRGRKVELRRGGKEGEFICSIKDHTIDQEKRDMSLTKLQIPEVDGYYICLIGWTLLPQPQIEAICEEVLASFGSYSLLRNNCQHFLKQVADRILVPAAAGGRAADYEWFESNTKTKYQRDQWLRPPPEEMLVRMVQAVQGQVAQMQVVQQNQLQGQLQNQLQVQLQNQLQNQLQMQLQMQLQTQMQMQMQQTMAGGMGA